MSEEWSSTFRANILLEVIHGFHSIVARNLVRDKVPPTSFSDGPVRHAASARYRTLLFVYNLSGFISLFLES